MPNRVETVYFLSDYGARDEFAGVVHALIVAGAPGATVIDLTHQIPPFDVRAGSHALVRAVPHLGAGIVLGVVDPGVGTSRRGLCMEIPLPAGGTMYFVGPDNGLLVAAAESAGEASVSRVVELRREHSDPSFRRGVTFDGRDVFAPAVAALCRGTAPEEMGEIVDPASLVRLIGGVVEHGRLPDGRACLRAEVTWVDHFGNVQLAATVADALVSGIPVTGDVELAARLETGRYDLGQLPPSPVPDGVVLRCVDAFGDLGRGELGLLTDANGHLAVVAGEASAAHWLNVAAGELVVLAW